MYKDIIGLSFSEMKQKYPDIKMSEEVSKVITITNRDNVDTYSNKSDVLLFYDVITEELLTIAERLHKDDYRAEKQEKCSVEEAVAAFNEQQSDYQATTGVSGDYVDITVVHKHLTIAE